MTLTAIRNRVLFQTNNDVEDLNEFEPTRMVKLFAMIVGNTPRDWANDMWGGFKRSLNIAGSKILSTFADTRYLGY